MGVFFVLTRCNGGFLWLQGLQFVRVLRLVDILLSSQRLHKLVQTIELSLPHALNLGALVLLSYFIFENLVYLKFQMPPIEIYNIL